MYSEYVFRIFDKRPKRKTLVYFYLLFNIMWIVVAIMKYLEDQLLLEFIVIIILLLFLLSLSIGGLYYKVTINKDEMYIRRLVLKSKCIKIKDTRKRMRLIRNGRGIANYNLVFYTYDKKTYRIRFVNKSIVAYFIERGYKVQGFVEAVKDNTIK